MNRTDHSYTPPRAEASSALPADLVAYLDGRDLPSKMQALRISTVDEEGWPHAALLSAGDMVATPAGALRFAVFAASTTAANLHRDPRVTVTYSREGGMCEVRLTSRRLGDMPAMTGLALFEADPVSVRFHRAPYASVSSGITFFLFEQEPVVARWTRQIEALRAAF